MRKQPAVEDPTEDLIPNHHHDTPCQCGHRHAEHSMFGPCKGCNDCDEDDDLESEHVHPYQRCACTNFQLVTATTEAELALTG